MVSRVGPALAILLLPSLAAAQVFVYPRHPDKSVVRNFRFDWHHVDLLVGPQAEKLSKETLPRADPQQDSPVEEKGIPTAPLPLEPPAGPFDPPPENKPKEEEAPAPSPKPPPSPVPTLGATTGGVRLFFYERERVVAERAAPLIEAAYRYLVERFKYVPTRTFPYVLYSSYQEFLQTNLFPLQEGTLGVTSPEDLKLTLPYLGDHQLFDEVSTHELAHEFTIQKVRSIAEQAKEDGDPLSELPLWFIEGLAEFYAKRGLDPETEMLVRDLVINPDVLRGYAYVNFFEEGPYGFLWIYKMGQTRCAFLEETYGAGTLQRVLEQSPRLVSGTPTESALNFEELLEKLTGDKPAQISARFESWLKRRSFRTFLAARQDVPAFEPLAERQGIITALGSDPEGHLLAYRSMDPNTGRSRLILVDERDRENALLVVTDGVPGFESLHPTFGRNFDLTRDALGFVAERGARDVIYLQHLERKKEGKEVELSLARREAFALKDFGLLAAMSLSFAPDGQSLAFVGLKDDGTRDVFLLPLQGPQKGRPRQLTFDAFSERQVSFGEDGVVYNSDATSHRFYNLFRVQTEEPHRIERLTVEPRDHADPVTLPDGRLFFVAYDTARSDLYEWTAQGLVRRTDVTTGLFEPTPGPDGGLWALLHQQGERRPVLLRKARLLSIPVPPSSPASPAAPLERRSLADAQPYRPFSWENIDLGPIIGMAGAGSGGFIGQVFASASDRLRNHALMLNLSVWGSVDLLDGYLLYLNQSQRLTWGGGPFQSLRFRVDQTFQGTNAPIRNDEPYLFTSGERFLGAMALARYPFSTFLFAQAELGVGGASYFLDSFTTYRLINNPEGNFYEPWRSANAGMRFQTELTTRLGYDTLRYALATGPIEGTGLLLEAAAAHQPTQDQSFGHLRLDAERYLSLIGRTHVFLRGGAGTTLGGRYARSFFLSSFDTLRGARFGDVNWLLGQDYAFTTLQFEAPLNSLIRVALLSDLEAVAGVDFGGVGASFQDAWDHRILDVALGVNLGLGPLLMRLHFARPLDVGAPAGLPVRPGTWVTNFSFGIAGLNGFFRHKEPGPRPQTVALPGGMFTR